MEIFTTHHGVVIFTYPKMYCFMKAIFALKSLGNFSEQHTGSFLDITIP